MTTKWPSIFQPCALYSVDGDENYRRKATDGRGDVVAGPRLWRVGTALCSSASIWLMFAADMIDVLQIAI